MPRAQLCFLLLASVLEVVVFLSGTEPVAAMQTPFPRSKSLAVLVLAVFAVKSCLCSVWAAEIMAEDHFSCAVI